MSYEFAGSYENQVRAAKRLSIVLPLSLAIIFLLLYFQFRNVGVTLTIFSGVFVAWGGGFLMLWLYAQPWFLDADLLGANLRELFQVRAVQPERRGLGRLPRALRHRDRRRRRHGHPHQAVDGEHKPDSIDAIRKAVVEGGRSASAPRS